MFEYPAIKFKRDKKTQLNLQKYVQIFGFGLVQFG